MNKVKIKWFWLLVVVIVIGKISGQNVVKKRGKGKKQRTPKQPRVLTTTSAPITSSTPMTSTHTSPDATFDVTKMIQRSAITASRPGTTQILEQQINQFLSNDNHQDSVKINIPSAEELQIKEELSQRASNVKKLKLERPQIDRFHYELMQLIKKHQTYWINFLSTGNFTQEYLWYERNIAVKGRYFMILDEQKTTEFINKLQLYYAYIAIAADNLWQLNLESNKFRRELQHIIDAINNERVKLCTSILGEPTGLCLTSQTTFRTDANGKQSYQLPMMKPADFGRMFSEGTLEPRRHLTMTTVIQYIESPKFWGRLAQITKLTTAVLDKCHACKVWWHYFFKDSHGALKFTADNLLDYYLTNGELPQELNQACNLFGQSKVALSFGSFPDLPSALQLTGTAADMTENGAPRSKRQEQKPIPRHPHPAIGVPISEKQPPALQKFSLFSNFETTCRNSMQSFVEYLYNLMMFYDKNLKTSLSTPFYKLNGAVFQKIFREKSGAIKSGEVENIASTGEINSAISYFDDRALTYPETLALYQIQVKNLLNFGIYTNYAINNATKYCDLNRNNHTARYLTNIRTLCQHYILYSENYLQFKEVDLTEFGLEPIPNFNPYKYATPSNNYNPYAGHSCQSMFLDIDMNRQVLSGNGGGSKFSRGWKMVFWMILGYFILSL